MDRSEAGGISSRSRRVTYDIAIGLLVAHSHLQAMMMASVGPPSPQASKSAFSISPSDSRMQILPHPSWASRKRTSSVLAGPWAAAEAGARMMQGNMPALPPHDRASPPPRIRSTSEASGWLAQEGNCTSELDESCVQQKSG